MPPETLGNHAWPDRDVHQAITLGNHAWPDRDVHQAITFGFYEAA